MSRLGDPTDIVVQADVLALTELKVAAETARVRLLEGASSDTNGLVRLENLVRRAEARVGLEPATATKEESSWHDLFTTDEATEEVTK